MTDPRTSSSPGRAPDWLELDLRHLWHPYTQMKTAPPPIPIFRGKGVWLETADGRRILDGISSWWVNCHGHSHPRLNEALARQASELEHVIFAGFTHEPGARLAAELVARAPGDLTRVFYSDDGSTAVEAAMKMAYQAWRHRGEPQRTLFIALDDAYHGDTFGAMAAGGVAAFHGAFSDLFCEVRRVATPTSSHRADCGEDLQTLLDREGERVAAVLVEPLVQGAAGMLMHPPDFLHEVRRLTRQHGVPLIADEIFTGFGRTGRFFACEYPPDGLDFGVVEPDLLCVSKALTGGYLPLAATLATDELFDTFLSDDRSRTFFHGHSYTGNALACAVGLESLKLFDEEQRMTRVGELAALFGERLEHLAGHPRVKTTRGMGAIAALEVEPEGAGGYLDDLGPRLYGAFLDRGVLLRPLGNVVYFLPPYVVTDDEAHRVFDAIEEVLGEL
ncbi:MAG: adenosylmethionine--8-amino-7-oxononanoate transaminase [Thermoanaerobaculia bacterium]|nr:adenosylmethionine--8-amino-7-oxononanoate transaminase [Thermoanaerobaculia bacterium]